jgi:hypothetical protein
MAKNEEDLKHFFPCISVSWYIVTKSSITRDETMCFE